MKNVYPLTKQFYLQLLFCFLLLFRINSASAQIEITPILHVYQGGSNVSCNGASNGRVHLIVSGGTEPYWYAWSNGSFNQNQLNLTAGAYTVVVTDALGLTASSTFELTQPQALNVELHPRIISGVYHVSDHNATDGRIETEVSGGTNGYSFLWNNNSTEDAIENLGIGNYSVTVTDLNQCTASASTTLIAPSPLHVISISSQLHHGFNVSCNGQRDNSDGAINLSIGGGAPPYRYHWTKQNSSFSSDAQNLVGLSAGHYSVIINDNAGVIITTQINLTEPPDFRIVSVTPVVYSQNSNLSCNSCTDGSMTVNLSGGVGNKTYHWSCVSQPNLTITQTGQTATNLSAGTYAVTATDDNFCTASYTQGIVAPPRDDWSMTGNSGITSSQFIGTSDNSDLVFKTNNTEQLRIFSNGMTTFQGSLKLNNLTGADFSAVYVGPNGQLYRSPGPINPIASCSTLVPATWKAPNINSPDAILCGGNAGINISVTPTATLDVAGNQKIGGFYAGNLLFQAPTNGLLVQGHVGIATTNPLQNFHVNGSVLIDGNNSNLYFGNSQSGQKNTGEWGIEYLENTNNVSNLDLTYYQQGLHFWKTEYTNTSGTLVPAKKCVMYINNLGNVGIGVDIIPYANHDKLDVNDIYGQPYKLSVNGSIRATSVKVYLHWADYVFDKNYKLKSLDQLSKFIEENNHLPGIPTASEVAISGVDLGSTATILLEKVEELTLYVIQLKKENDLLKNRMNEFENK